ncbi:hypothetical protein SAMN05660860_02336 [Geoalkalibacter ferrihydriticus]|uniref:Uncharacterized protein n=2 Tax=Geoalkalibacter ferrihydriticus TaxID=392333 RepID=A0A0C2HT59_9BACT|nr:hypothetical protein [Geoalkalibacter ferrihydriticus]KIH77995.1 hypothetical protein GFER_05185 [Geoalkalibacter ferrihydriticus DSM 17813]SDM33617.1 hypothetical protein SAMN05660860_02336 [Geoalkalibacter ferrihydriticus]
MAISGSPAKLARDIADGYLSLTPPVLKQYTPAELKTILNHIALVGRDLRQEKISIEDVPAIKNRNMKLSRLNQNSTVLRAFCKKHRIPI